jgi:cytochrome c-type biogenesis protein CcmH/NrfG
MLLGRSYTVLKNISGAEQAYLHAVTLKPTDAAPSAQLAELLVQDRGAPPPTLVKLAEDAHKADARQPLALFILGAAKAGAGDAAGARKLWDDAAQNLPANSPLKAEIVRRRTALH